MEKETLKPHLHTLKKISAARQIFGTVPRLPVPRLPPAAPLKFSALVPHYIWDLYVYTSKIGSAVP